MAGLFVFISPTGTHNATKKNVKLSKKKHTISFLSFFFFQAAHIDIRPVGTTTYLLWRVYTSRGIQRAKNYRNHNKDELILRKENMLLDIKATLTPALGHV